MGCIKGAPEIEPVRVNYRGLNAFQDRHGCCLLIKGNDGRLIYSERTDRLYTKEEVKTVIDSIKDYRIGRW